MRETDRQRSDRLAEQMDAAIEAYASNPCAVRDPGGPLLPAELVSNTEHLYTRDGEGYVPSRLEIAQRAAALRTLWTDADRQNRNIIGFRGHAITQGP